MEYKRLHYEQYFIDTSENYNRTGKIRNEVVYNSVDYSCNWFEKLFHFHHEVNFALLYDEERDVIQIHFQKTNGNSDWMANILEFPGKYYDAFLFNDGEKENEIELSIHRGWGRMYKTIKKQIRADWLAMHEAHPSAWTEVIGWSLGSGQAMLCCQDLNWNYGVKPYLYTFGSVRPFYCKKGTEEIMDRYLASITSHCYNFANRNDLVTYMPPFRGFRMIARKEVGGQKVLPAKLLNPFRYHTMYDRPELYTKKN